MMQRPFPHPHVEYDSVLGYHVVKGTSFRAARLFAWYKQGTTVETLLRRYPRLGPARIFGTLAWAHDNHDIVTREIITERDAITKEQQKAERDEYDSLEEEQEK